MMIREFQTRPEIWRYFWLKTVRNVNLNEHCTKCLIGDFDLRLKGRDHAENIPLNDSVYYLCGVNIHFKWELNFHLAFEPCKGSVVDYTSNGVHIVIEDAIALPISEENVDVSNPYFQDDRYRTCRNWQFAHWFKKNRIIE